MASLNKIMLIGNLGADPEMRYLPSGDAVANVRIATTESWKDKDSGDKKESVEWHRVSFFGKLAEIVGEYLKKGSPVYVEGHIKTRKWHDKDGKDKYSTEIVAEKMQMLGGKSEQPEPSESRAPASRSKSSGEQAKDFEDDIPW